VGKEVLKINPAYPKLQSDIIDKARVSIRCWYNKECLS
jgi:hypothetical protein